MRDWITERELRKREGVERAREKEREMMMMMNGQGKVITQTVHCGQRPVTGTEHWT